MINHAITQAETGVFSPEETHLLLDGCKALIPPPPASGNPIDITPTEFRKLLKVADDYDKALFLTALNLAYYPIDCQRLAWSMIDWETGVVRFDREKAKGRHKGAVPRIGILWERTKKALKKIQNGNSHVFISSDDPAHTDTLYDHFRRCRKRAEIERHLTFANIRDSALTAAASSTDPVVPQQQYNVLAGHVAKGVDDNYIRRNKRMVAEACKAIENYYFGVK